jgi:hypothetical protein
VGGVLKLIFKILPLQSRPCQLKLVSEREKPEFWQI